MIVRFFFCLLFCVTCAYSHAQEDSGKPNRNISAELSGAHGMAGVNYDMRFRGNEGFGFRVGAGFGFHSNWNSVFFYDKKTYDPGFTFPIEINYLKGAGKNKFELGLGTSLGWYNIKFGWEARMWLNPNNPDYYPEDPGRDNWTGYAYKYRLGYFMFCSIGYRYQPTHGLMFRIGLTPSFHFGRHDSEYPWGPKLGGINRSWFYPYIGIGWSLP